MTKRMLIDAAHPEETRVVVMDGHRVEEFDLEAANRLPLKGNIYLARVVRVEPSLQAAFVEYGGNRHGFLAFGEIHPDYYQIPVADRRALLEAQAREAREEAEAEAREDERRAQAAARRERSRAAAPTDEEAPTEAAATEADETPAEGDETADEAPSRVEQLPPIDEAPPETVGEAREGLDLAGSEEVALAESGAAPDADEAAESEDERARKRETPRFLRNYKIQEVIKRRQVMLIQVVKEERGTKGAALTTYISLAGRFSVLMPNSPRGGGVSRKITSASDRRRLREVIDELEMPEGMSLIIRTAGAQRPKPEIRRDCEYLLSLWDSIRERTLASSAPALIYEEADLIKRSIRDGYARDMDEILVEGDDAYSQAREFMRMLMPEHIRKISAYRDGTVPLFSRFSAEQQLDAMHEPTVQLKSGGYIVINQTEALVAIDVNSGRSTRERSIEDTALRTNLEASDEIARQLRLRDLAGLIVIDYIDMDRSRDNAAVEKRLKDALRHDRARIQVGRISHFGLLELSRQRLRPSLNETAFVTCQHCLGRGTVRSLESSAIAVLRAVEEECARRRAAEITVKVNTPVALYLLNKKRERLNDIEGRWGVCVLFEPDDTLHGAETRIERSRTAPPPVADERPAAIRMDYAEEEEVIAAPPPVGEEADEVARPGETAAEAEERQARRRRRRGRGRGRREEGAEGQRAGEEDVEAVQPEAAEMTENKPEGESEEEGARRRRGRRGGRRRREEGAPAASPEQAMDAVQAMEAASRGYSAPGTAEGSESVSRGELTSRYSGPTPADPFGGTSDGLLDAMEAAEAAAAEALAPKPAEPAVYAETPASTAPEAEKAPEPKPAAAPAPEPEAAAAPEAEATPIHAPQPPQRDPVEPLVQGSGAPEVMVGPAVVPRSVEEIAASAPRRSGFWKR